MDRTWSGAGDTVPLMQQTPVAPLASLDAVLERITYASEETGTPWPGWPPTGPAIC